MQSDYKSQSALDLVHALEYAGRIPDLDLIRELLARREEVTPILLQMLSAGIDESWEDDDPRWYREVHAGNVLLAFREPRAIPQFMQFLRDPEKEVLLEWFPQELDTFGVEIIGPLEDVLRDETAYEWGRISAGEILARLAKKFPAERGRIIVALRDTLPAVDADGNLILPPFDEEEPPEIWSWSASALAHLHDLDSRRVVKALYDAELIDEGVMGDYADYVKILMGKDPAQADEQEFDIFETYHELEEAAKREAKWQSGANSPSTELFDVLDLLQTEMPRVEPLEPLPQNNPTTFVRAGPKIGRNDPCPCGSGRKYKHCHGK